MCHTCPCVTLAKKRSNNTRQRRQVRNRALASLEYDSELSWGRTVDRQEEEGADVRGPRLESSGRRAPSRAPSTRL